MNPVNGKNKYIPIALVAGLLLLALGIAWILWPEKPEHTQDGLDITPTQGIAVEPMEITDPVVTEPTAPQAQETEPEETEKPQNISDDFLCAVAGSDLVIEKISAYDGPFLEDGSDKEVTDVTAILLTNMGDNYAEYAEITLNRDGTQLKFIASALAPGSTMLVLEADGKAYCDGTYTNCTANVAAGENYTLSENQVRLEERDEGGLTLTNLTQRDIPCVRIFYKFYKADTGIYIGGITYTAKVTDLAAGSTCVVTPSHYLKGYSKVIKVVTYDTDA